MVLRYLLHISVSDGKYGGFDGARWNGMISEVLEGEADMAVADLSITTERLNAVEFSMPWMNLGQIDISGFITLSNTSIIARDLYHLNQAPEGPAESSLIPGAVW